jgi:ABC-type transport system involved in cytochrome c biogenesis permease subunit
MRYRWLMEAMPTMAMLIPLEMAATTEELTADELTTAMLKAVALTAVTVMLTQPAPKLVGAMVKLMELLTTVTNLTQLKAMETELPS